MFFINQKKEQDVAEIVDATKVEKVEEEIATLRAKYPSRRIVVITGNPTWQGARAAFEAGANDYLLKVLGDEDRERRSEEIRRQPIPQWSAEAA